ncbi:hypothetical protein IIC38_09425 [candidate division KSB1 bacterium]|nr:hypothetical protein [candidate division KSB1 bacterium]
MKKPTQSSNQYSELSTLEEQGPLFNVFLQQTDIFFNRDLFMSDLLEIVKKSMQARACSVRMVEEDKLTSGVALGYKNLSLRRENLPIDRRIRSWLPKREPWIFQDIEKDPNIPKSRKKLWLDEGFKSCAIIPLMNRDRPVIGILSVFYNRTNSIGTVRQNKLLSLGDFFAYMLYNSVLDEDIKELKRLIQSVVEFTTDSIFVTDKLGKILYASKQAIQLFRRKIYSLIGSDIFQLDRSKESMLELAIQKVRNKGLLINYEIPIQLSPKRILQLELSISSLPLHGSKKREILLWIFRDKTSLFLAEKRLIQKKKELEEFVYSVSHDLKSPIVSVLGYASLLKQEVYKNFSNTNKHYFDRLVANIELMEKMIQDLLELSRVGKVDTETSNESIGKIVKEAVEEFRYQIENKKIKLILPDRFPKIVCHSKNLKLVFTNLISNAIKFHGNGKQAVIEIGVKRRSGEFEFFVKDNGVGIPVSDQEEIFNAFYRTKQMEHVEGTGIGLAVTKKIIEDHGGQIYVESKPGQGTIFHFTLPKVNNN